MSRGSVPALTEDVIERARRIVEEGTPPNTRRAYSSDWRYFEAWCEASGLDPILPVAPDILVRFIVDHVNGMDEAVDRRLVEMRVKRAGGVHTITTIRRRVASIAVAHNQAGLESPCGQPQILELLNKAAAAAARRGWAPRKKAAASLEVLDAMLAACEGDDLWSVRDRAILLFGWSSGGRRRSEIASAVVERLDRHGEDYVYRLGVTKTSQGGDSGAVPIAGRAARAMENWLVRSRIDEGPIFRRIYPDGRIHDQAMSDRSIARIVQSRARAAGLDASVFGGHSLRSGFITEAGLQGINLVEAMALSLHRSIQVASGYHQAGAGLRNRGARLAG